MSLPLPGVTTPKFLSFTFLPVSESTPDVRLATSIADANISYAFLSARLPSVSVTTN